MGEYGCHGDDHLFIMCIIYILSLKYVCICVYIFEYIGWFSLEVSWGNILIIGENLIKLHTHAEKKKTQTKKLLYNLQKTTQQQLLVFLFYVFHSTPTDKKTFSFPVQYGF